jgi:DNA-directed RNA polymerase specialized sigma24 family protein
MHVVRRYRQNLSYMGGKVMEKEKSVQDLFFKALKDYCADNQRMDMAETKFGIVVFWVERNTKTGERFVFDSQVIENPDEIELYLYRVMRNQVIDQICIGQADDVEHLPEKNEVYQAMIPLIHKYMPFIQNVEAYMDRNEKNLLIEYFARALEQGLSREQAFERAKGDIGTILAYAVTVAIEAAKIVYNGKID